ncbi:hypothetical protein AOQ84DRAFT_358209 [Glonium stellatum]|uniref:F-box domain-containing protein n=1 Tax=Glonium stellatum TaxID=574774 RepID=A0A8E2FDL4_9PEZI|nr:hypothetical protein AOQ84DRAFT_358209 [Glonium stellatum]
MSTLLRTYVTGNLDMNEVILNVWMAAVIVLSAYCFSYLFLVVVLLQYPVYIHIPCVFFAALSVREAVVGMVYFLLSEWAPTPAGKALEDFAQQFKRDQIILQHLIGIHWWYRRSQHIHNQTRCILHRFPPELLLQIQAHLPESAIHSLSQTSQKMRRFTPKEFFPIQLSEVDLFATLIERDRWLRYCRNERRWMFMQFVYSCSSCRRRHPYWHFSHEQKSVPPQKRHCIGAERKLRLCKHHNLNLSDIRLVKDTFCCMHKDHKLALDPLQPAVFQTHKQFAPSIEYAPEGWSAGSLQPLFEVPQGKNLPKQHVELALNAIHARDTFTGTLCPHVPVNDPRIVSLCNKLSWRKVDQTKVGVLMVLPSLRADNPYFFCEVCYGQYRACRWRNANGLEHIYLDLRIKLGDLEAPSGLRWIAATGRYYLRGTI